VPPQPLNIETSSMHFFSLSRDKIKHLGPTLLFNLFCAFGLCIQILQCFQGQDFVLFFFCSALVFFGLFGFSFVPPQLLLWVYYLTRLMALLALLFVPLASLFIPFVLLFGCWLALLVAS